MSAGRAYETLEAAGAAAPWLTLVHGATQDRRLFECQIPAFSRRYRLLRVDLAGHGQASDRRGPYGPVEYTAGVLAAMHSAGVTRSHFWGTHTGAQVGLMLAVHHRSHVVSLILEGAVIPGDVPPSVARCFQAARASARSEGLATALETWFQTSPWFEVMRAAPQRCRAAAHRDMLEGFGGNPWLDDQPPAPAEIDDAMLAGIDVPTLLISGEHEVADFLPGAERLARAIAGARRAIVPGAGGFPLWEDPERVNALVMEFLSESET